MSTISLCLIVKNEELVLERCLKSAIKIADEVIIVDTGSTDNTKEIAKKYTDKIYDFVWCNDFSKARNFAFSFAKMDYIMWLDADDVVPTKTLKYLMKIKENMSADVYMLKYDIAFINNKPTFSYFRERIVKNCNKAVWSGAVHECITPFGKIEKLKCSVLHKKASQTISTRNLKIYEYIKSNRHLTPREEYYYGRELFDHKKYKKCISVLNKFVNSGLGWRENVIDALYLIGICYKNLNNDRRSLNSFFLTFSYDTPRANICCEIGDYFIQKKQYTQAIYWYKTALNCKDVSDRGGFVQSIYYNYYPCLQLCCCYYYLGDVLKARKYNTLAGKYYYSEIVKNNETFFANYK